MRTGLAWVLSLLVGLAIGAVVRRTQAVNPPEPAVASHPPTPLPAATSAPPTAHRTSAPPSAFPDPKSSFKDFREAWRATRRANQLKLFLDQEAEPGLMAGLSFDDDRYPERLRPAPFEAAVQRMRDAMEQGFEGRSVSITEVDCSAVPCFLRAELMAGEGEDAEDLRGDGFDTPIYRLVSELQRASSLGPGSSSYISIDGGTQPLTMYWLPYSSQDFPHLANQVDSALNARMSAQ